MSVLETWRASLPLELDHFLPVMKKKGIDLKTGVLATAVLWPVRHALSDAEIQAELKRLCGEVGFLHVVQALPPQTGDPLEIVQRVSSQIIASPLLHKAIDALLVEFVGEIVAASFLEETDQPAPSSGDITTGSIHATNVNIGGRQYIRGDQINNIIKQQEAIRSCPMPPSPPARFGGRQDDYDRLKDMLAAGTTSAIAGLRGVGGIGKTTLARQLAHDLYHKEPLFKAVVWSDINQTPNLRSLLISWGQYSDQNYTPDVKAEAKDITGIVRTMLEDAIAQACSPTRSSRVLVVLDDIWEDGLETARTLLKICPNNATVLVTTRFAHIAQKLAKMTVELDYLDEANAAELLERYLEAQDEAHLKRLAKALGGHPLALKLAAQHIRQVSDLLNESIADTLAEWTKTYEAGIPAGSPFKHLNLEEGTDKEDNLTLSLALSYAALPTDADRARFRALGVLAVDEAFDAPLLAALWQVAPEEVKAHVLTLRQLALMEGDKQQRSGWFTQHRLLRAYAHALLAQADEEKSAFARYATHVTGIAGQFRELNLEQWSTLDEHLPQIRAVGDALAKRVQDTEDKEMLALAGEFSWNTMRYLNNRPAELFVEGGTARQPTRINWFEMGLKAWQTQENQAREATTLNNIGRVWADLGEKHKALEYYGQALPLYQAVEDRGGKATALSNIGGAWSALGERHKALDYFAQALPLYRAVGDRSGEATTLNNIGAVWDTLGERHKALEFYEQALPLRRAVGNRSGEATTLNNIGSTWSALGETRKALDYFAQALPLTRVVGDRGGEAVTLNNIGKAWSDLGERHKALDYYEQALPVFQVVGDRGGEATTLNNIGYIYFQDGEFERTVAVQLQILEIVRSIGDVAREALYLFNIAMVYQSIDRIDEAIQSAQAGKEILLRYNLPQNSGGTPIARYDALLAELQQQASGQPTQEEQAAQVMRQLAQIYQQQGAEAVRQMLAGKVPDEVIEAILTQLAAIPSQPPIQNNLPADTVQKLAQSTYAVKTAAPDQLAQWRETLTNARADWQGRGDDWAIEVEFADALLAILENQPPSLPADNPYATVVRQVMEAIQAYRDQDEA